jgi:hypothetical protein
MSTKTDTCDALQTTLNIASKRINNCDISTKLNNGDVPKESDVSQTTSGENLSFIFNTLYDLLTRYFVVYNFAFILGMEVSTV